MEPIWKCIVVTCPSASAVEAVEREVDYLQKESRIPSGVTILTIEDPAENIGSGAATLNALVVATEFLSVQQKYMVITTDVLSSAHILILLHGRNFLYSSCGKAFISMPTDCFGSGYKFLNSGDFVTNLEVLFHVIKQLSYGSPPGVWVCSTDMLLLPKREDFKCVNWETTDAVMFCVSTDINYATDHGTVAIDDQGLVEGILYCSPVINIEKCKMGDGHVPIVAGIVYLSVPIAESLLFLQALSPLDSCTYMGLDSGAHPMQVSLFFDILVAMSSKISKDDFLSGRCGKVYNQKAGFSKERLKRMHRARLLVWEELSRYKMSAKIIENCLHIYWSDLHSAKQHVKNLWQVFTLESNRCGTKDNSPRDLDLVLVNSILFSTKSQSIASSGTVICHSQIRVEDCVIGKNCFISGIHLTCLNEVLRIPDDLVVLGFHMKDIGADEIIAIMGIEDSPTLSICNPSSTLFNRPWKDFFKKVCIKEDYLWDHDLDATKRTLMNAKLYPSGFSINDVLILSQNTVSNEFVDRWMRSERFSLADITQTVDHLKEFDLRRNIYAEISSRKVKDVLCGSLNHRLLTYFHAAYTENFHGTLLDTMDNILLTELNPVILTRTLSCVADMLGTMAGKIGGLRSGPGSNKSWATAFDLLQKGEIKNGMLKLCNERMKWINRPDRLIRAARHYERAAQILIQNSVKTAQKFINLTAKPLPDMNQWILVECPARIDLQGGWTDTPPICYEMGGSVVNIAVLVDGKKPIGARARRIRDTHF